MRKFLALVAVCLMLVGVLSVPAYADSAASNVDIVATVNSDGDCLVTMTVMLRMEAVRNQLSFPLPLEAKSITMNGSPVAPSSNGSAQEVDISRITRDYVGEASVRFEYTIPEAVKVFKEDKDNDGKPDITAKPQLMLTLPMLSGFELPIERLTFTITMPGTALFSPRWNSIYRQESIASDLEVVVSGSQVIGSSKHTLNDHEGMTMTMIVPETMFPTVSMYIREGEPEIIPMAIFAGLALLYWLIFLFTLPLRRLRTSTAPEGITAGEMGCRLTRAGGDLTSMVFTWAQLGYLLISLDGNGRVLINKRMDMGNERGPYENKVFNMLFGNRRVVDATGNQYAKTCIKVSSMVSSEKAMYKGNSGNMKLFRFLCCGTQVFCGINVAMNMAQKTILQILMAVILGVFGAISAWLIHEIAYRTHLRGKIPVYVGLGCVVIWILLGILCGQPWVSLVSTLGQWAFGFFAAYGGRRSDIGRYDAGLILGFRRYLKHLPRESVGRLMQNDPDYFFNLAPYALALGVIRPFGAAFGRRKIQQCPYLLTRIHGKRSAEEWARLFNEVADMMDSKAWQMQLDKTLNVSAYLPAPPPPGRKKRY